MSELMKALEKRDKAAFKSMLSYAQTNIIEDNISPLMYASYWGLLDIIEALLSRGADIDMENDLGKSALHFAAIGNKAPVVAYLCSNGAKVDKQDNDGNTALHRACDWGSQQASKELIKFGADTTLQNHLNATPLQYAADIKTGNFRSSLSEYIDSKPVPNLEQMLQYQQRQISSCDDALPAVSGCCSDFFDWVVRALYRLIPKDSPFKSRYFGFRSSLGKYVILTNTLKTPKKRF
jgi:hypothetical protein